MKVGDRVVVTDNSMMDDDFICPKLHTEVCVIIGLVEVHSGTLYFLKGYEVGRDGIRMGFSGDHLKKVEPLKN